MKQFFVVLIAAAFVIFLALGYVTASALLTTEPPESLPASITDTPYPWLQTTVLFIHADNLESPTPRLISVWAVFIYPGSPNSSLTFLPLYPYSQSPNDADLGQYFYILSNGVPDSAFFDLIRNRYSFNWNGYMIIDDSAASMLLSTLGTSGAPTDTPKAIINSICNNLNSNGLQASRNLPWNELAPAHFRTDFDFVTMTSGWESLTNGASMPQCEVLDP